MAMIENLQKEVLAFITDFDLPGNGNYECRHGTTLDGEERA